MTFNPNQNMRITAEGDSFYVACPFWANNLLEDIGDKRWHKSKKMWKITAMGDNVAAVINLGKMAGVLMDDAAKGLIKAYADRQIERGKRGVGFPAWYKFKRDPLPHQREALDKAYDLRPYALHFPLQTGKTKTAIDMAAARRMEGKIEAVLVLVKRTLRRNWINALNDDCPIPFWAYLPDTENRRGFDRFLREPHDFKWMLVGWESLSQGAMADWTMEFAEKFRIMAIGDETTYISNYKAGRTQWAIKYGGESEFVVSLTGTPALEGPMNLFTQYKWMDPEIIGIDDFLAFRNRYAIMGGYQREVRPGKKVAVDIIGYRNLDELLNKIAPYTSQVEKTAVLKLPPKRTEQRYTEITKTQREVYDKIKREGVMSIAGSPDQILENCLGVALRLHQVTGGYGVVAREVRRIGADGNPKVKIVYDPVELVPPELNPKMLEVVDVVEGIRGKMQFLLWAQYAPEIQGLLWHLNRMGLKIGQLHGGVPDAQRQPMVDAFSRGELDCILGNPSTGGMGFTMMAAEANLFYNNSFKAIDRIQAEDRNWGQGQTKSPIVIDFFAERTFDMTVWAALQEKMDMSEFLKYRLDEITKLLDGEIS